MEAAARVFETLLEAHKPEYDDWLYSYCGALTSTATADEYMRHLRDLLAFARVDIRGKDVLDAGSGFGFTLIALGLLGARTRRGIEIFEPMVKTAHAFDLPPHLEIRVDHGSVMNMPYEDGSFDVVLAREAISHYRDVDAFLRETHRVLRPGGVLLISDGNNKRHPKTRRETQALWREFETGVAHSALGDQHHRDGSYRLRRREIIQADFPQLDTAAVEALVDGTAMMDREEVLAAVRRYVARGTLPDSTFSGEEPPVDPETGAVIERLLDPYELTRDLRRLGFETRVAGYWGGAKGKRAVRAANHALAAFSRVTLGTTPAFRVAATKQ